MTKSTLLIFSVLIFSTKILSFEIFVQDSSIISDSLVTDPLSIAGDSTLSVPKDTLKPLPVKGIVYDDNKTTLKRIDIRRSDYRFTGDLLTQFPFSYHADLGSVGNPSEVYFYGLGFGRISYLQNGVPINNRFQNAFDLNQIQTESIDSIVVPSLSSGFFYNAYNNPVSVNFVTRLKVDPRPYSRLRFYQGPENEGVVDGLFSAYPLKRLNVSLQISNQSADSRYTNSELSNWMFNTRVRYMPTNSYNLIAGYDFSKINMGLNGGVNVEVTPSLLYDNIQAEINYEERYHKNTRHNLFLKNIFRIDSVSYSDITFYYQDQLDEFRQNELAPDTADNRIVNDNGFKTYGLYVNQELFVDEFNFQFLGRYEKTDFAVDASPGLESRDLLSLGANVGADLINNSISPSFFVKWSDINENQYIGWGANVSFKLINNLSLTTGYSQNENPSSNSSNGMQIIEAGVTSKFDFTDVKLSYFNMNYDEYIYYSTSLSDYYFHEIERSGLDLKLDINLWKFQFSSNSSHYFNESKYAENTIPDFSSYGGLYYVDTLFNSNLDLKVGVNYKYFSGRNFVLYDFQFMHSAYYYSDNGEIVSVNNKNKTNPGYQFDFFLAGRIRERATIYIAFENIFNSQYYIVPYYPVQPSGLRIGFSWEFLD